MTPAAKRQAVAHVCTVHEVSERRACTLLSADRSMVRYRTRRPDDFILRQHIKELALARRRFGYRRLLMIAFGLLGGGCISCWTEKAST